MVQFSKLQSQPFENKTIQNLEIFVRILNGFDKMAAICPDFRSHRNMDHLQTKLFLARSMSEYRANPILWLKALQLPNVI